MHCAQGLRSSRRFAIFSEGPRAEKFPASTRDRSLAKNTRFYAWLRRVLGAQSVGAPPKKWAHRYATFRRLRTNFVLVVSDGQELHQRTLYHLGNCVQDKAAVVRAYELAQEVNATIKKLLGPLARHTAS